MKKQSILVVGGGGYIGAHVTCALLDRGHKVVVCDNFSTGYRRLVMPGAKLEEGNLGDKAFLNRLFSDNDIAAVMHLAAYSIVPESVGHPLKYYENNVANTLHLLEAMRAAGCPHFILSSTAAVYGEPDRVPIHEEDPKAPTNPYGTTKLVLEGALADLTAAGIMKSVSLRYFNAAGADPQLRCGEMHDPETHLIPIILQAAAGERTGVKIFGTDYPTADGSCVRDYVHVTDIAAAHLLALDHLQQGDPGDVFNLGSGNGFSVREVIDAVKQVTGRQFEVEEVDRRPGDPAVLVASSDKIRDQLGWRPTNTSMETIVSTAWQWYLKMTEGA